MLKELGNYIGNLYMVLKNEDSCDHIPQGIIDLSIDAPTINLSSIGIDDNDINDFEVIANFDKTTTVNN